MSMTVNNQIQTGSFDWNALVDKINTAAPAANVQGASFDATTGNVTFTVGGDEGTQQVTLQVPELESPGAIDQAEFASLVAKLGSGDFLGLTSGQVEEIKKTFAELAGTPLPASTGSVMFDIYALMVLMLECAQKQRDAAREIRQAENQAIRTAIQNQADAQRSAALTGMIAGLAVGLLQVAMQGFALAKSASGAKMQMNAMRESGVSRAQQNVQQAKAELAPQEAKLSQMQDVKAAQDNLSTLQAKTDPKATAAEIKAAEDVLGTAKAQYTKVTGEKAPDRVSEADIKTQELLVNDKKSDVTTAIKDAEIAQQALSSDANYVKGRFQQEKWHNMGDIFGAMGGVLQSMVRSAADLQSAEATEMGAEQKWMEEERDQTKDLFMQAQDVVKAVLSLFNAVIQAESASMRDAIHA